MEIDFTSATWRAVKNHLETEIEQVRTDLETPQLEPSQTEHLRGKIAALRSVLDLSAEKPQIGETNY